MTFKSYADKEVEKHEMKILQSAFDMEGQSEADAMLSLVTSFGEEGEEKEVELTPEQAEAFRRTMELYIRERQSLYSDALDAKVAQE